MKYWLRFSSIGSLCNAMNWFRQICKANTIYTLNSTIVLFTRQTHYFVHGCYGARMSPKTVVNWRERYSAAKTNARVARSGAVTSLFFYAVQWRHFSLPTLYANRSGIVMMLSIAGHMCLVAAYVGHQAHWTKIWLHPRFPRAIISYANWHDVTSHRSVELKQIINNQVKL